jgi:hypothetical protein
MKRYAPVVVLLAAIAFQARPAFADDPRLLGVWRATTYTIDGVDHPMDGLLVFTRGHYATAVRFSATGGPMDDSNGNSGPYTADGSTVVFTQWVQIHVRPGKPSDMVSNKGPDEASGYRIEGNQLIITFPSKNRYVLQRIE